MKEDKVATSEQKIIDLIGSVLVTRYNCSLIICTSLLWLATCYFGYYNSNFDMLSTISNYIIWTSLLGMIAGIIDSKYRDLTRLGILTLIITIFTLAFSKSVIFSGYAVRVLTPVNQFCFFLLLKNIWLVVSESKNMRKQDEKFR